MPMDETSGVGQEAGIADRGWMTRDPRSASFDLRTSRSALSSARRRSWLKWALISIVIGYVALIVLAPLGALVASAFAGGPGAIVSALSQPDVLSAFWRTLLISVIV